MSPEARRWGREELQPLLADDVRERGIVERQRVARRLDQLDGVRAPLPRHVEHRRVDVGPDDSSARSDDRHRMAGDEPGAARQIEDGVARTDPGLGDEQARRTIHEDTGVALVLLGLSACELEA